jgi:hypothetical protein
MNTSHLNRIENFTKRYDRIIELRQVGDEIEAQKSAVNLETIQGKFANLQLSLSGARVSLQECGNMAVIGLNYANMIIRRESGSVEKLFDKIVSE